MPLRFFLLLLSLALSQIAMCSNEDKAELSSASSGFAIGLAAVDERIEEAAIFEALTSDKLLRQTKGVIGEANTENALSHYLNRNGRAVWRAMTPRTGSQGIDHLFVKFDESGSPIDLYVGESKWGTSRLGNTKDGRQMSYFWSNKRLRGLGQRYSRLATNKDVACRRIPKNQIPNAEMSVMLKTKDGKLVERVFWRENSQGKWFYSGPFKELGYAKKTAQEYGLFYERCATARIGYRRGVYHWNSSGDDLVLRIDTINKEDVISKGTVENKRMFVIKEGMKKPIGNVAVDGLARQVKKQPMFSDWEQGELRRMVRSGANSFKKAVEQERLGIFKAGVQTATIASVFASGIDVVLQKVNSGSIDWEQVAKTGGRTLTAVGMGELAGLGMMKFGIGNRLLRSGVKAGVVLAAFSAFDYYQVYKGNMSWEDANANTAIGLASMGAGAATGAALMALPAALGATASTGVAISSLSGAAATSSTLAVYGGGTVAAGGFGVWGGAIVVGGVAAIAAIGVGAAAAWGYGVYKEKKEWNQMCEWGCWLHTNLREVQMLKGM